MPMAFLKNLYTSIDCQIQKCASMRITPSTGRGKVIVQASVVLALVVTIGLVPTAMEVSYDSNADST